MSSSAIISPPGGHKTQTPYPPGGTPGGCLVNIRNKVPNLIFNELPKTNWQNLNYAREQVLNLDKARVKEEKRKENRIEVIGRFNDRTRKCGIIPIAHNTHYTLNRGKEGNIYFGGMQKCGNIWLCPSCAFKIMKQRSADLYEQLEIFKNREENVYFITFTLQHYAGQRLNTTKKTLLDTYKYARTHRNFREWNKKIKFLRVLEIKHGKNGWHPHIHALFVGNDIEKGVETFRYLYEKRLNDTGLLVNEHTVKVEKWDWNVKNLPDYLVKNNLDKEITGGTIKESESGRTFFQLVDDNLHTESLIREYIQGTKGHRQYHHSRDFFDKRVKTDEEILNEAEKDKKVLAVLPESVYGRMLYHGIVRKFLTICKTHSVFEAIIQLDRVYGIPIEDISLPWETWNQVEGFS